MNIKILAYPLMVIFSIACVNAAEGENKILNDNTDHAVHGLPAVNIDSYANELAEYQRLQRENLILKLRSENSALAAKTQNSAINRDDIALVAIMSDVNGIKKAKVYDGWMRIVTVGDVIMNKFRIIKVGNNYIEIYELGSGDKNKRKIYL